MRWRGRRPGAVTAVILHRLDGCSGGASCGLESNALVRLRDDLAGRLEMTELRVKGAGSVRDDPVGEFPYQPFFRRQRHLAAPRVWRPLRPEDRLVDLSRVVAALHVGQVERVERSV